MERFTPPILPGHLQPRDGSRLIRELRGLFLERHSRHQIVHAFTHRERWIEVGRKARRRRKLRDRTQHCCKDQGEDQPKRASPTFGHEEDLFAKAFFIPEDWIKTGTYSTVNVRGASNRVSRAKRRPWQAEWDYESPMHERGR